MPDPYDFDLFVIGGGSGGVRAARIAAQHGARVAIAEEYRYGGTCVIRGCVPKKLFVYASEYGYAIRDSVAYGWKCGQIEFAWQTLRENTAQEISRLSGLYQGNLVRTGVAVINGRAVLVDAHTVAIAGMRVSAAHILIATGGRPRLLDVPGGRHAFTSNDIFQLASLPPRVAVVGGGYIGIEFAHILAGLGVHVSLIHHRDRVLRGFDEDVRTAMTEGLVAHGIDLYLEDEIEAIQERGPRQLHVQLRSGAELDTAGIMAAIGRVPNTSNMGLEQVGVALDEQGGVLVDRSSRTSVPHIYAVGDCTNRLALTPVAIREGHAFADTVFGDKPTQVDYDNIPTAVFGQPPSASVGLTEDEAVARLGAVDIYKTSFRPMKHTLSGREQRVMMKLIVDSDSQRVVGAHMVGLDAAEIIQCVAVAMQCGATKADFDATVALHPTTAEELVLLKNKTTRTREPAST